MRAVLVETDSVVCPQSPRSNINYLASAHSKEMKGEYLVRIRQSDFCTPLTFGRWELNWLSTYLRGLNQFNELAPSNTSGVRQLGITWVD